MSKSKDISELDENFKVTESKDGLEWYDIRSLAVEGLAWQDTKSPFDRLPAKAEGVVREPVWSLQQHSAGVCVRFQSDAESISARWNLINENLQMGHMPSSGVSGLDLYVWHNEEWQWLAVGVPTGKENDKQLIAGIEKGMHSFMLYLPLYNGVSQVEIGLPKGAKLQADDKQLESKPVCFYGTSILHGGCASRPGLAYPSIISRRLNIPHYNLGFSGNAHLDLEVAELLAELDPCLFVIDALPNNGPERIIERFEKFIHILRKSHKQTPILCIENIRYQQSPMLQNKRGAWFDKNVAHKTCFDRLIADGVTNLHYLSAHTLLGSDGEATVDGTHPNDLGFMRMADAIQPYVDALR